MAKVVFSTRFSETEVQYCNRVIRRHTLITENCYVWKGSKDRDGYGMIQFQFRGKRVKVRAHRLVYYIRSGFIDLKNLHVSHLCHNKSCINFEHLSLEPHDTNNKRKTCILNGECIGHCGYRSCIL